MAKADLKLAAATGDIEVANGDLVLIYDDEELRQRLKLRLQDVQGDWFRDTTSGMDYFGSILGKFSKLTRQAEIRRVALGTDGVAQIRALELETTNRNLDVTLEVVKEGGGTLAVRFEELLGS